MKSSEAHTRPRADSAKPLAVDDGHHGRRTVGDERNHVAAADRSGDGRDIFVRRGENLLDGIVARRQTADNQRLIQFGAASRAKGEERAAWVARSGDTKGERLGACSSGCRRAPERFYESRASDRFRIRRSNSGSDCSTAGESTRDRDSWVCMSNHDDGNSMT